MGVIIAGVCRKLIKYNVPMKEKREKRKKWPCIEKGRETASRSGNETGSALRCKIRKIKQTAKRWLMSNRLLKERKIKRPIKKGKE